MRDRRKRVSPLWQVLCVAAVLVCAATPALPMEAAFAPWPKGFNGFMSGVLPPEPGYYGTSYYYFLDGIASREVRNGLVEFNGHVCFWPARRPMSKLARDVHCRARYIRICAALSSMGSPVTSTRAFLTVPVNAKGAW